MLQQNNKYIDGLVQDCSNSSALAIELLQSCTKPYIYIYIYNCPTLLENALDIFFHFTIRRAFDLHRNDMYACKCMYAYICILIFQLIFPQLLEYASMKWISIGVD